MAIHQYSNIFSSGYIFLFDTPFNYNKRGPEGNWWYHSLGCLVCDGVFMTNVPVNNHLGSNHGPGWLVPGQW